MKKLRSLMVLWAVMGMTAFMTGCGGGDGDDDDDNGGGGPSVPQNASELRAQQYTLNIAGQEQRLLIFPSENAYQLTIGTNTYTGTFTATQGTNQWTITVVPDQASEANPAGTLVLSFASSGGSGNFTFTPDSGTAQTGTFTYVARSSGQNPTTGGTGGENPSFAPATETEMISRTYTIQTATSTSVLHFPAANTYQYQVGTATPETGNYMASRSGEEWTLQLTPSGGAASSTARLNFTSTSGGMWNYTRAGEAPESGTFTATTGSTTNGGSTGETNGGTNGNNTGLAPAIAGRTANLDVVGGPYPGEYRVTFNTAGGFNVVRRGDNNAAGDGTYTYTPNGDNATLVLTYSGEGQGADTLNLTFTSATSATYTGSTAAPGGTPQSISGTFVLQ